MHTFKAIEQRRSVKHYDPVHEMTDAEVKKLMSLAMLSPTSFNIQNWRFVVVRDKKLRRQIRAAAWDQAQITDASIVIVLCAHKTSFRRVEEYWVNAPEHVRKLFVDMTLDVYEGREDLQVDEAHRSCGMAAQTIMLAAKAMGYDTCAMVGFDFDKVTKIIRLPQDHLISMLIVVGKALKPPHERGGQLPLEEVVIYDHF